MCAAKTKKSTSKSPPKSALAPKRFPKLAPLYGVSCATYATQMRYQNRDDLLVMRFVEGTQIAGLFTQSSMASVPVDISRTQLAASPNARGLVVNAGIANAFTGMRGVRAARKIAETAARQFKCKASEVFMASTGVIGDDLDPAPICAALKTYAPSQDEAQDWQAAASAIMTTDTFPKAATCVAAFGDDKIRIHAIAKGSGMIAPDMATMLCFIVTDAAIPAHIFQKLLVSANAVSLNAVSVDSDTSTSDMVLGFATGRVKLEGLRSASDKRLDGFRHALTDVLQDIAIQLACDGEGARKLITIDVCGAANDVEARQIGLAIANSPLVKTAVAGGDANWGRIVMAIGKSGARAERDRVMISIGGHVIAKRGRAVAKYEEAPVARHMRGKHIDIAVDVGALAGRGQGVARVWSCDLTHGYIDINADYRS